MKTELRVVNTGDTITRQCVGGVIGDRAPGPGLYFCVDGVPVFVPASEALEKLEELQRLTRGKR